VPAVQFTQDRIGSNRLALGHLPAHAYALIELAEGFVKPGAAAQLRRFAAQDVRAACVPGSISEAVRSPGPMSRTRRGTPARADQQAMPAASPLFI